MVREELGPDAVILSNREVEGGVEMVSAIDYDEDLVRKYTQGNQEEADPPLREDMASISNITKPPSQFTKRAAAALSSQDVRPAPRRERPASGRKRENKAELIWSQEPALVEMRQELKELRGLLENQLSGLAWNDTQRRFPKQAEVLQRLSRFGLSPAHAREIIETISGVGDLEQLWHEALSALASQIQVTDNDILNQGGVVALVGPTGVGKTTTVAKLAARFALRHGSRNVALVTLDTYRIGAYEQLRAYGRILDIPVRVAGKEDEFQEILDDLSDRRLVLIDTAGMSQRDSRLPQQLEMLTGERDWLKTYLVLSTTTRLSALEEIVQVYGNSNPAGAILTKLDETTSLGNALSIVVEHGLPVAYVSDGQRVPEDLHTARAHSLVNRGVTIMKDNECLLEQESLAYSVGRSQVNAHV